MNPIRAIMTEQGDRFCALGAVNNHVFRIIFIKRDTFKIIVTILGAL